MIRRLFWLGAGFCLGVWVTLRGKRLARSVTPQGLAHRAADVGRTLRDFAGDVRAAATAREQELRSALELDVQPDTDKDRR